MGLRDVKPLAQGYTSGKWWHPHADVQIKMQSLILNHRTAQPLIKHGKMDLQPWGEESGEEQECPWASLVLSWPSYQGFTGVSHRTKGQRPCSLYFANYTLWNENNY